jgi:nicotinate-nucleotide adenylyltransferase
MTRLAAAGLDSVEVSDAELRRAGPSYTVDTLADLRAQHPGAELYLVLGWDAAREIRNWHQPERVLALARVLVLNRPGLAPPTEADLRAAGLDPERVVLCTESTPDIQATRVREVIASGGALDGLLPPLVAEHIRARGLYRGRVRE